MHDISTLIAGNDFLQQDISVTDSISSAELSAIIQRAAENIKMLQYPHALLAQAKRKIKLDPATPEEALQLMEKVVRGIVFDNTKNIDVYRKNGRMRDDFLQTGRLIVLKAFKRYTEHTGTIERRFYYYCHRALELEIRHAVEKETKAMRPLEDPDVIDRINRSSPHVPFDPSRVRVAIEQLPPRQRAFAIDWLEHDDEPPRKRKERLGVEIDDVYDCWRSVKRSLRRKLQHP